MNCIISVGETLYLRMFCARYPAHAPFDPLVESRRGVEELSRLGKRADDATVMGIIYAMEEHGLLERSGNTYALTDLGVEVWKDTMNVSAPHATRFKAAKDGR